MNTNVENAYYVNRIQFFYIPLETFIAYSGILWGSLGLTWCEYVLMLKETVGLLTGFSSNLLGGFFRIIWPPFFTFGCHQRIFRSKKGEHNNLKFSEYRIQMSKVSRRDKTINFLNI